MVVSFGRSFNRQSLWTPQDLLIWLFYLTVYIWDGLKSLSCLIEPRELRKTSFFCLFVRDCNFAKDCTSVIQLDLKVQLVFSFHEPCQLLQHVDLHCRKCVFKSSTAAQTLFGWINLSQSDLNIWKSFSDEEILFTFMSWSIRALKTLFQASKVTESVKIRS